MPTTSASGRRLELGRKRGDEPGVVVGHENRDRPRVLGARRRDERVPDGAGLREELGAHLLEKPAPGADLLRDGRAGLREHRVADLLAFHAERADARKPERRPGPRQPVKAHANLAERTGVRRIRGERGECFLDREKPLSRALRELRPQLPERPPPGGVHVR
jgi:hypothetical protein